ncbi:type II secretion system protein [Oscillibacter sp.]|uniref:type II secretion system protein n=1 Tax=Oscillibacter sp. TaxID=1945593 RepID=UPI002D7F1671|nr:type II secretion system protein [Oscillibacter sp.]
MEQLKAKLKKQGGFTMVELLIVVAIIAILVAVSIPMMNNALEKSRHAVDQANVRSAVGLALTQYTVGEEEKVEMYYCVDDEGQGYLGTDANKAVKAACKCNTEVENKELAVSVTEATTGDAPVEVETSFKYDKDSEKTVKGTDITVSTSP